MSRAILNKLLAHSFTNYQILYNELTFHNHNPHHLGSLYLLGATDDQMEKTYKTMCHDLEPYAPSPQPITLSNWREHLGDKHFCKSYRDFFHEQLTKAGVNWHKKLLEFLLENEKQPLINSVVSGAAHPIIHIGYAFELNNELVGAEALAMSCVAYNYLHEVGDKLKPPTSPSKSPIEILKDVRNDTQLPINEAPGIDNLESTVKDHADHILSYYNQWNMNRENLEKTIEELFDLSVYLYGATHKPNYIQFDFFLIHLLTAMHGIRMTYPHINNHQIIEHILLEYFYFAILIYITQSRPEINGSLIYDYTIDEKKHTWDYVIDRSLNTKLIEDAHLVKVIRALRDAERAYGNKNNFYLKTAVKTVDNLDSNDPWIGGSSDKRQLNILKRS